jgi:hypothetical protein
VVALVAGGTLLGLVVLIQAAWRLAPPVSRLEARAAARSEEPDDRPITVTEGARAAAKNSSPVVLTEMAAVNRDVVLDDAHAPSDWIELYNRSEEAVSLGGWRLVESGRPRRGWVFPALTLAPRSYLIVWASGKDRIDSAASRRVNTRLTRTARRYHRASDIHLTLPGGAWKLREARRVDVDIAVPTAGRYTLWMKARADGLSGTVRIRPPGSRSRLITVPGGRHHQLMIGDARGVPLEPGVQTVTVAARTGTVDVLHFALVSAGSAGGPSGDDSQLPHVHASFRIGRGREGVMLVDPAGVVRDEAPAVDHPPTLTLQRDPGALAWRVGLPTPAGQAFHPPPDLTPYPSVSAGPLRIEPARSPGVEEFRYTVDGSVPTLGAPRLETSLRLTKPTTLRLRGYAGGAPVTSIVTRQFWVGPLPDAPTLMVALDPHLIGDAEVGIVPNDRWRRQQEFPDNPALGPLQLTRRRVWSGERRHWIKPGHLLALDREGVLYDGRARIRRFTMAVGPGFGFHIRTRDPVHPARDFFGRQLTEPGRAIIVDEDDLNVPSYDAVRAAGGIAPLTRWGTLVVNGANPDRRVFIEPVDEAFLRDRWGHTRVDLIKGKAFAVKRGTIAAFDTLVHRMERGVWTAAEVAPMIDLPHLIALHFTALFLGTGENGETWQTNFVVDHDQVPPRIHAVGWDLDNALKVPPTDDTFARHERTAGRPRPRDGFVTVMLLLRLLEIDPEFRQRYLREAERLMNHVLTPTWWDAQRRDAGGPVDPDRVEHVAHFFRERAPFIGRSLATGLDLPPPRTVHVDVQGPGALTIDGYPHRGSYVGRYFEGGAIEIAVPAAERGAFRHFTVNGRREPGPVLRAPVTEDLAVVARFGD